eukprot:TRINITY_DN29473_c0_g1_i2.p1 TRINITY_DN29473_c0_g1~~TRINITY_DN29473_c0_g1_i2.p1  ORF type:complete len:320 (-),score=66.76 TRINITY_DN29473_c0_g1_i2:31-990(-)
MLTCDNGHPIVKCKEKLHKWQGHVHGRDCSLCKDTIMRRDRHWRCEERCDFNVCTKCYDSWQRRTNGSPDDVVRAKVGTSGACWSASQAKWLPARVVEAKEGEVTMLYGAPHGGQVLKRLPADSPDLRFEEKVKVDVAAEPKPNGAAGAANGGAGGAAVAERALLPQAAANKGSSPGCFSCFGLLSRICDNRSAAEVYLERKAQERGIVKLPSGLLYKVMQRGRGKKHPKLDSWCSCHYRGALVDGHEFDSSYGSPAPVSLQPKAVIKGWQEAMPLMVEGDIWELYVPPSLGYGKKGMGNVIPGDAVLVFTLELIRIRQ